nr:pentatricopeptide repeat protein AaPPR1163 [Agave angustifolia]
MASARKVFDEITDRDLVSWNSMISGCVGMGFAREAVELFRGMREAGFEPCERTLASVLKACGSLGDKELGKELEGFVEERGVEVESFVGSALVNMHGKCGDLVSARRVFDGMKKRELAVWNSMITGYAQNGMPQEAIKLFNAMRKSRTEPDKYTIAAVLSACASVGALDLGSWVDDFASRKGLLPRNVYISTALIDMYAKCGNLDRAIQIFEAMPHKNVVSWNAMISGMASHGHGQEAIRLFHRMLDEKEVPPNDITFVGLLSACVHTGLVSEGRQWFSLMETKFGITPKIEHQSCMVDLLARAGHVEEAWEFIEKMPEKPDAVMLGALLNACRNFKNVEVGERVMKKILEIEPSNSGNYVIASKIYARSNRLEESARMRGLMKERGVSKTPGCSWIEINGEARDFHAGDRLHPEALELNWVIDLLAEEMKKEGYTPNIDLL